MSTPPKPSGSPPDARSDSAPLAPLVAASTRLAGTSGRNDKVAIIAEALQAVRDHPRPEPVAAALGPHHDVALAATYLAGEVPQDRLEVGWATVRGLDVPAAPTASLRLADVDAALDGLAGAGGTGSRAARQAILTDLFAAATAEEQDFLTHLILGELRQGALEGVVVKSIAIAAALPEAVVRRALMLSADLGTVAALALHEGRAALEAVGVQVGRGVQPMLAATAPSVTAALAEMGTAVVEWKLDGARIQVHKDGDDVRVLTRNLNDVTARSPDVVAVTRQLAADRLILDGEVLAMDEHGRPSAFQDTMSAFADDAARVRMSPFFFDVLHRDGEDLIDVALTERLTHLQALVAEPQRIASAVISDPAAGEAVLADALAQGHEGVMVKDLNAPYAAGRRGKAWRKVKPVTTLDLVVLAVEWGSGRRQGTLSNIHLGAVDDRPAGERADRPGTGDFVMLGKTFKGMTDAMLAWQTTRFLELETHRDGHVVHIRAEQVVEIAIDGIQVSRRYPGGVALRFARVLRYRDDKSPAQADTLSTVRALGRA